jgi:hypothetical protein
MIVARSNAKTATGQSRWRRRLRRLVLLGVVLCALAGTFVAGAYFQREGDIRRWRDHATPAAVVNYLRARVVDGTLPTLTLDIKYKDLHHIEQKRAEALQRGILLTSDEDFVPARLSHGDETYPAKIRLKGDWTDHLETDRWSYRIQLKDGRKLFGMRRFSIQHPATREFHLEWAFHENARAEGLAATRYRFVDVVVNGTPKGIYALEEHFAAELLESQERRAGVILKFDEGPLWINRLRVGSTLADEKSSDIAPNHFRQAAVDAFGAKQIASNPDLAHQRDAGIALLRAFVSGERPAAEIFDIDLLARYLALTDLWNADHALSWSNYRFYYNPITARLEPIAFDCHPRNENLMMVPENPEPFVRSLIEDPTLAAAYVRELRAKSRPEYLEQLREQLDAPTQEVLRALHREWPALQTPWGMLAKKQAYMRGAMAPAALVVGYLVQTDDERARLEIASLLNLPVELVGYQVDRASPPDASSTPTALRKPIVLPPVDADGASRFVAVPLPSDILQGDPLSLSVSVRIVGDTSTTTDSIRLLRDGPRRPPETTRDLVLSRHPFLTADASSDALSIRPGTWEVTEDLVLPPGTTLRAGPGTTLRFAPDALLLTSGPVLLEGSADRPVVLEPSGRDWPGILVDRAAKPSVLRHVEVRGVRGINRHGWSLTGGLTFYASPVTVAHVHLADASAEDGINVVRADVTLVDSILGPCDSDAVDFDFVTGTIERCTFNEVGGDAVDFSGSTITLRDLEMRRVVDKGISAGEASRVSADEIRMSEVGIGAASKDHSTLTIRDLRLEQARIGLAAYTKKLEYGPAKLDAIDVQLTDVKQPTLVQEGSTLRMNGSEVPGAKMDPKALYDAGILGN